jgi:hypothetical protein
MRLYERAAQKTVPRATLDTHKEWLADIIKLAKTLRMILSRYRPDPRFDRR